ncbi:hypothetical protein COLO4_18989 [Corchorus olitorius]|uniref:Uncharacterized protein n=1 Tax=Corchorus olitorius TaxID=93759 RepID=A0A1R3J756_9ROSI|nr:hypothetical protein COLO4_18989 [Corchorus olitorius]
MGRRMAGMGDGVVDFIDVDDGDRDTWGNNDILKTLMMIPKEVIWPVASITTVQDQTYKHILRME